MDNRDNSDVESSGPKIFDRVLRSACWSVLLLLLQRQMRARRLFAPHCTPCALLALYLLLELSQTGVKNKRVSLLPAQMQKKTNSCNKTWPVVDQLVLMPQPRQHDNVWRTRHRSIQLDRSCKTKPHIKASYALAQRTVLLLHRLLSAKLPRRWFSSSVVPSILYRCSVFAIIEAIARIDSSNSA